MLRRGSLFLVDEVHDWARGLTHNARSVGREVVLWLNASDSGVPFLPYLSSPAEPPATRRLPLPQMSADRSETHQLMQLLSIFAASRLVRTESIRHSGLAGRRRAINSEGIFRGMLPRPPQNVPALVPTRSDSNRA